jgi:hypothetical protein
MKEKKDVIGQVKKIALIITIGVLFTIFIFSITKAIY